MSIEISLVFDSRVCFRDKASLFLMRLQLMSKCLILKAGVRRSLEIAIVKFESSEFPLKFRLSICLFAPFSSKD